MQRAYTCSLYLGSCRHTVWRGSCSHWAVIHHVLILWPNICCLNAIAAVYTDSGE